MHDSVRIGRIIRVTVQNCHIAETGVEGVGEKGEAVHHSTLLRQYNTILYVFTVMGSSQSTGHKILVVGLSGAGKTELT